MNKFINWIISNIFIIIIVFIFIVIIVFMYPSSSTPGYERTSITKTYTETSVSKDVPPPIIEEVEDETSIFTVDEKIAIKKWALKQHPDCLKYLECFVKLAQSGDNDVIAIREACIVYDALTLSREELDTCINDIAGLVL